MAFYSKHVPQTRKRLVLYYDLFIFIFFITINSSVAYEKTLRKIVRKESKMEQRPFSEMGSQGLSWATNSVKSLYNLDSRHSYSNYLQVKTMFYNRNSPKISTYLKPSDSRNIYSKLKFVKEKPVERLTRNTVINNPKSFFFEDKDSVTLTNFSDSQKNPPPNNYQMPTLSYSSFGSDNVEKYQNIYRKDEENEIEDKDNTVFHTSNIFDSNQSLRYNASSGKKTNLEPCVSTSTPPSVATDHSSEYKVEETIRFKPVSNESTSPGSCIVMTEVSVDIDTQLKFNQLNIEPSWMQRRTYWGKTYDRRYNNLMRNSQWPPLKVIMVPTSHVDTIWKRTFEQYYNNSAHHILTNIVKKLNLYNNLTFSWNEVSHLSHWWKTTTHKNRAILRRLVKTGRFEITTGGWVEPDEATASLFTLVHQLIEGHQWLKKYLNYGPQIGCLTSSVTHSPTMIYLLSASEIVFMVFTNVHYAWENYLSEYQYSDFIWIQNWDSDISASSYLNEVLNRIGSDRYPKNAVFAHFIQFNSAGIKGCGPDKLICLSNFNFAAPQKKMEINNFNVKQKSELLLEQYSKTGTLTPHNVIIAPIGGPYHYEVQAEIDYQFVNYQKLTEFINYNSAIYKASAEFGTYKNYFNAILSKHQTYPTLKGDFPTFADINNGIPAYWTGYFTTRPMLKILLRRLQSTLRSTEILFSFASNYKAFKGTNVTNIVNTLIKARRSVARLSDRNVLGGTLTIRSLRYVYDEIITTTNNCWYIQEVATSLLTIKPGKKKHYLQKYLYRDGEFITLFRSIIPGDNIYIFNSLSHERTEIIELISRRPNIKLIDHNKKEIKLQVNPVWKYGTENIIKISRKFFKVIFAVVIPPMTLELFKVKEAFEGLTSASTLYCLSCMIDDVVDDSGTFPFQVQPLQAGDIQLENYQHRVLFDEETGFIKSIFDKETNIAKSITMDYGAFRSSDKNAGIYLFNTNVTKPLHDFLSDYRMGLKTKLIMITSGFITTEITIVYGRILHYTVKLFNTVDNPFTRTLSIESKLDLDVSPKNRDLEFFLSIETDIQNGNPPELFTDNNGFQYSKRMLNISRRIESNVFPMTNMAYIQDELNRLTVVTDHAQGVTSLQEGQILIILDRRILYNDGKGVNEGLADSSVTLHRHYLVLENFGTPHGGKISSHKRIELPSLTAMYLSNSLNYQVDVYLIQKNFTNLIYFTFLPLVKVALPCDVAVVNFRVLFKKSLQKNLYPDTALLVLHRQSYSCRINSPVFLSCNGNLVFNLKNIFRHVTEIHRTNLVGTNKINQVNTLNEINFPPMELATFQLQFASVLNTDR